MHPFIGPELQYLALEMVCTGQQAGYSHDSLGVRAKLPAISASHRFKDEDRPGARASIGSPDFHPERCRRLGHQP